jgi:hypothetical protein
MRHLSYRNPNKLGRIRSKIRKKMGGSIEYRMV